MSILTTFDPQVADAISREAERQEYNLELIASENFVSEAVLEAQGSILTNKSPACHQRTYRRAVEY